MTYFSPPAPFLTLEEAALALTERTGKAWTPRQILGCAERHQIGVFARISGAARFVRVHPVEGSTNEIFAEAGSLPRLDTEAIRALLLTDEAQLRGWEGLVNGLWQTVFELAPDEEAPEVRNEDCRVTAAGVLQLVDTFTKPAQTAATPAPVVAASESPEKPAATIDRGWTMKRAALIKRHERQWPTIDRDLQDASDNDLSRAAKAPLHGEWFEADALNWARQRGKLSEATERQAPSPATVFSGLTHRIKD